MRSSGVVVDLDALGPGDHVCWVVDEASEYEPLTRNCLTAGRAVNDKLLRFGPVLSAHSNGVFTADPRRAFLEGGPLRTDVMLETFRRETDVARREGYRGLRVVADMDWLVAAEPDADELLAFELRLDEVVAEVEATVVCAYRATTFEIDAIARMVSVHPLEFGPTPGDLGFRIWNAGDRTWRVSGEIDFSNAEAFRRGLAALAVPDTQIRLHFDGLTFIDVAGMRAMARVVRDVPGVQLRFEGTGATFRRCWELLEYGRLAPAVEVA